MTTRSNKIKANSVRAGVLLIDGAHDIGHGVQLVSTCIASHVTATSRGFLFGYSHGSVTFLAKTWVMSKKHEFLFNFLFELSSLPTWSFPPKRGSKPHASQSDQTY